MKLSVLDLIPTRTGQSTSDALAVSAEMARTADRLRYHRFWVAEHHNMPAVASTVPGVLIPYLAQGTERIRFGSGGVMLPNHAAFAVAEQFALLEAMFPGRIDLGLGRAPGSDPVTAAVMRGGSPTAAVDSFAEDVNLLRELLGSGDVPIGDPVGIQLRDRPYALRATPRAVTAPEIWLLGSSSYSADLAAREGLPYAFAHHFGAPGLEGALARYRLSYQPSAAWPEPTSLLPVNVAVSSDPDRLEALIAPHLIQTARLRTGASLNPLLTVEEAQRYEWSDAELSVAQSSRSQWFTGTADAVATDLKEFADLHGVDELMLSVNVAAFEGDALDTAPDRVAALESLASELL